MRKENKKNKGFSLVELIIVIAIMVILGAIIAPQYFKHVNNAKISSDIETAARISSAISAEFANQETGVPAGTNNTLVKTGAWTAVGTANSGITGTVGESKVESGSNFYYSLDADGNVRIAIGTAAPATGVTNHIISPLATDAAKWTRK